MGFEPCRPSGFHYFCFWPVSASLGTIRLGVVCNGALVARASGGFFGKIKLLRGLGR